MATDGRIFISYRRQETAWPARQLYEALCERFGVSQVFKDVDNIAPGEDFVARISDVVGSCRVLLAMIGPHWMEVADEDGNRRIDDPDDFVRLEVATALDRGVLVVPILVDGARMPKSAQLPADLAGITRRQAIEINPTGFNLDRLFEALEGALRTADAEAVAEPAVVAEPEVLPPPGPVAEPEVVPEAGPAAEPEVVPEAGPAAEPEVMPESGSAAQSVPLAPPEPAPAAPEPGEPPGSAELHREAPAPDTAAAEVPVPSLDEPTSPPVAPVEPLPDAQQALQPAEANQPAESVAPQVPVRPEPPKTQPVSPPPALPPAPAAASSGARRGLLLAGAGVLVVAGGIAAWLLLGNRPPTPVPTPSPVPSPTVLQPVAETISVDRLEVGTGVACTPGRVLSLTAAGQTTVADRQAGPDGSAGWFDASAPVPQAPLEALIGRVGGEWFYVGDTRTVVCPGTGELELGMNSLADAVPAGSLTAELISRDDLTAGDLSTVQVVVPATASWLDSGFECTDGEAFRVSATGIAGAQDAAPDTNGGPDGVRLRDGEVFPGAVLRSAAHRALLGRVADGDPFLVGSSGTLTCPADGTLELQVNDGVLEDNTGEFTVELSRWPA